MIKMANNVSCDSHFNRYLRLSANLKNIVPYKTVKSLKTTSKQMPDQVKVTCGSQSFSRPRHCSSIIHKA